MSSRHDKRVTMTSSPADAAPLSLPSTAAAFDPFASGETSSTEVDVFALLRLSSLWVIIENIGNRCKDAAKRQRLSAGDDRTSDAIEACSGESSNNGRERCFLLNYLYFHRFKESN